MNNVISTITRVEKVNVKIVSVTMRRKQNKVGGQNRETLDEYFSTIQLQRYK